MAIEAAGISEWSVIERALAELRQQPGPFLPSTGDFIALCRNAALREWRVPSEPEAFAMLQRFFGPRHVKRDFTKLNPAVYAAYSRLDWATVSAMPMKEQRKAFREAFELVLRDIAEGRPLKEPPAPDRMLEEKPLQRCYSETSQRGLESLKSLVGL